MQTIFSYIFRSARWCITHPWLAYVLTIGALMGFDIFFPLLPIAPRDVKGILEIERKVHPIFFTLCYAWYVVGVAKLAAKSWPHSVLALFMASTHMYPFWEMKRLNAASDHHPWGTWEQALTLGTLVLFFIGIPVLVSWLCVNRIPGWRAGDAPSPPAECSPQL
jgi:hypothetical protein